MRVYVRWLILALPLLLLGVLWEQLPTRVVIHTAQADKWVSRDDYGGIVVSTTCVIALLAYGLLQVQQAVQPMPPQAVEQAYLTIAIGAASVGMVLVILGLAGR